MGTGLQNVSGWRDTRYNRVLGGNATPKYIKIKSATGKGEMVVKRSLIERVEDRDDGGATIHCSDCVCQTASTASEVLEAMEGKPSSCPTHFVLHRREGNTATSWHHADLSTPLGERIHPDAFKETNTPVAEPSRPTRCVTYSTYSGGKVYELSLGPDGATSGYKELEQETASEPPIGAVKSPACTCEVREFPFGSDDCPTHGIGTAWRDLHGE